MNGKRAYAAERRETKILEYKGQIKALIDKVNGNPLGVDYSGELEGLWNSNPQDKPLILQAEREVYADMRKK